MKYSQADIDESIRELKCSDLRPSQLDILEDLEFTISEYIKVIKKENNES